MTISELFTVDGDKRHVECMWDAPGQQQIFSKPVSSPMSLSKRWETDFRWVVNTSTEQWHDLIREQIITNLFLLSPQLSTLSMK